MPGPPPPASAAPPVPDVNEAAHCPLGFVSATPVPVACGCGYDRSEHRPVCSEAGLHNHHNFPPFLDLPDENDADDDYYRETMGMFEPRRHWCLVGQVEQAEQVLRVRVQARSRFGERFMVHFHSDEDEGGTPKFFDLTALRPGASTICVLYPYQKQPLGGTVGIR